MPDSASIAEKWILSTSVSKSSMKISQLLSCPFIALIKVYQWCISPCGPKAEHTNCSQYALESFKKTAFSKVLVSSTIGRCLHWGAVVWPRPEKISNRNPRVSNYISYPGKGAIYHVDFKTIHTREWYHSHPLIISNSIIPCSIKFKISCLPLKGPGTPEWSDELR